MTEIPQLKFPAHWLVRVIPPLRSAVVRFKIAHEENPSEQVSIYLDCYDMLGSYGEPYWELYPHGEDTFRCAMKDTDALLEAIGESLSKILLSSNIGVFKEL